MKRFEYLQPVDRKTWLNAFLINHAKLVILLSVVTFFWGCGSDDDDAEPTDPKNKSELLTPGNAVRPTWNEPDYHSFELTMAVQFRLQEVLEGYVSENDLLCAIINDEVRAVSSPENSEGQIYFPLVIAANTNDSMVSIAYYCDQLKRIYTIENWHQFDASLPPLNNEQPYLLEFIPTEQQE